MATDKQLPAWWLYSFYAVLLLGLVYGTLNPCPPFWQNVSPGGRMVASRTIH